MLRTTQSRLVVFLLVMLAGATAACSSGSPTAPSVATVTGVWTMTFVDFPGSVPDFILTLSERSGSVSGTLQIAGGPEAATLKGTISADGQMILTATDSGGSTAVLEATVDGSRGSFTGFWRVNEQDGSASSSRVRGSKGTSSTPTAPAPTPTPAASFCSDFVEQPSYRGDCAARPAGTVCAPFSDGYVWLLSDSVEGRENTFGACSGHDVETVRGVRARYHHILSTNLVKTVPR